MTEGVSTLLLVAGTPVAVRGGAIAAEALRIGDALMGQDGLVGRVRWVGRTVLSSVELPDRDSLLPVAIGAGALGEGLPSHGLVVVAEQAIAIDGCPAVLARRLVDGLGVRRMSPADLPGGRLDVLVVEAEGPLALVAGGVDLLASGSAPGIEDADLLRWRARVARQAGMDHGQLAGSVDGADHGGVSGWAFDRAAPDRPVMLELLVDGVPSDPFPADRHRADLARAGIGGGNRAFVATLRLARSRGFLLRVRRAVDGREVPGSPLLVDAGVGLDQVIDRLEAADVLDAVAAESIRRLTPRLMPTER